MPAAIKVAIIYTGGTIGAFGQTSISQRHSCNDFKQLLSNTDCLSGDCEIVFKSPLNKFSECMVPFDWITIAKAVRAACQDSDGVVILHGTDTLCYTAYALAFMLQKSCSDKPVMVTGANSPLKQKGDRAWQNIQDCFTAIKSGCFKGVYVCFGGLIHIAAAARKVALSGNTYQSIGTPAAGKIIDGKVEKYFDFSYAGDKDILVINPNISFYKIYPGFKADLIGKDSSDAVVLEIYNNGTAPYGLRDEHDLETNISRFDKPVFATSQQACKITFDTYGSSAALVKAGVVNLEGMLSESAIVKLMWLTGQGFETKELIKRMKTNMCGELLPYSSDI